MAAGLAGAAGLAAWLRLGRLEPVRVAGSSMAPTLGDGTLVAVGPPRRPARPGGRGRRLRLRRGQLVLVRRPGDHDPAPMELVKRVVGLPGERVRLAGGRLTVDGRPVPEPYLGAGPPPGAAAPFTVALGPGEYLVLGDRRGASTDGRAFGPVRPENVIGIVRFVYWPPSAWRVSRVIRNLTASAVSSRRGAELGAESAVDGRIPPADSR